MICRADTVGVFQIESRAQMSTLPRLRPRSYYDLVIEISIVRPGPITGGMVHPYLRRRNEEEPVVYPHPCLEPVLSKTLGVPLFQEQVMRLAVVAADYTPGDADQLRRDMAAWHRTGRIERHRDRLVTRMMAKGIARLEGARRAALWEALSLARTPAASLALDTREPRPAFEALSALETIAWDYRSSAHSTRGHPLAPLWEALALARTPAASFALAPREPLPGFEALSALETIAWDYRSSAHSPRGHPLAPLRGALASRGLPDARTVATVPDGRRVRYAGIVICRQRPATACGVTFMTLEDETGLVNVVVWKRVFDEYAVLARTVSFLRVTGTLQCEYGVVHIVAEALWTPKLPAPPPDRPQPELPLTHLQGIFERLRWVRSTREGTAAACAGCWEVRCPGVWNEVAPGAAR